MIGAIFKGTRENSGRRKKKVTPPLQLLFMLFQKKRDIMILSTTQ
jgi:hypothetical protein